MHNMVSDAPNVVGQRSLQSIRGHRITENLWCNGQPEFCINVWSMQGTSQTAQSNAVDIAAGDDDARHLDDQASRRLRERYMCRSMPMHAMFAISDVPPALKNGSGIPMTGKSPTAMPMFTIV